MNPLERLGYANGQRLEAGDLRLEQRYHIEVRRLLNRGLFTPGVVSGLEVAAIDGQPRQVLVKTGIALDPVGRELVLRQETTVDVPNQKPVENPLGYFLVIRYAEQQVPATDPWCGTAEGPPRVARVREQPELVWSEHVPAHGKCASGDEGLDCGVVLALVVLDTACKVAQIQSVVREYSHPTHASQVQAIAFEGEKDIDPNNPKVLHFMIRGGIPQSAVLYLWGGKLSTLHYSELGRHAHTLSSLVLDPVVFPTHKHTLRDHTHRHTTTTIRTTSASASHRHTVLSAGNVGGLATAPGLPAGDNLNELLGGFYIGANGAAHTHNLSFVLGGPVDSGGVAVPAVTGDLVSPIAQQRLGLVSSQIDSTGNTVPYRTGPSYSYITDLEVALDDKPITQIVIDRYAPKSWGSPGHPATLGDGSAIHGINSSGTGVIDLMDVATEVGIDMGREDHSLTFSVKSGGGKVLYNLYVS